MFLAALAVLSAHADGAQPCAWRLSLPGGVRAIPVLEGDRIDEHGRAVCAWLVPQGPRPLQLAAIQRGAATGQDRVLVRRADGQPLQVVTEATSTPVSLPPTFLIEVATPAPTSPEGLFATLSVANDG